MTEPVLPADPKPFRVLLDEAMVQTRRHFRAIYPGVAIPLAALAMVTLAAQSLWMPAFTAPKASSDAMLQGCFAGVAAAMIFVLLQGLTYSVLTAACVDAVAERPFTLKAKWGFVLEPATLWTLLLAFLAIAGGFLLLIIPGIYISLMLSFVVPVMVAEGLRGGDAIGRSFRLTRYNPGKRAAEKPFRKVFLFYLVGGLISYAVSLIIQLPFMAAQGYRAVRTISAGQGPGAAGLVGRIAWWQVLSQLLQSLVGTAVSLYISFGIVLLYFDVVRRKEGGDLARAIEDRFAAPPPGVSGATL